MPDVVPDSIERPTLLQDLDRYNDPKHHNSLSLRKNSGHNNLIAMLQQNNSQQYKSKNKPFKYDETK